MEIRITAEEVVEELHKMNPQLVEHAAERVAGRKRDARIAELEAQLGEKSQE